MQQAKWTSTATNKLLLEAGVGTYLSNWNTRERPDNDRRLIQITEQCPAATGCANNGSISGLTYHGMNTWNADWIGAHTWNAAASYVTGTHNMKFGYQGAYHVDNRAPGGNNLSFRVANGVPNQLTAAHCRLPHLSRVPYYAFYAQDQWTRDRLTVQGAVRFDHPWSTYPEQSIGGVEFLPAVTTFPETRGVEGYNDITPRMGLAYDLRGNGKTALKFNMGRYLEAAVNGNGNYSALLPASRVPITCTAHLDGSGRRLRAGLRSAEPVGTVDHGRLLRPDQPVGVRAQQPHALLRPAIMQGWGVRPGDWQIGATLQHEVLPRVSMEVGYVRRWLQNFTVTDNRAQAATDFGTFSVTAPARSAAAGRRRLRGRRVLQRQSRTSSALTDNYRTYAPNYGNQYSIYNGLELSVNARLRNGIQLQAGSSTGSQVTDDCEVRAKLPEIGVLRPAPRLPTATTPLASRTRATAAGSYTIPKIDVLLAGTFQSSPGVALAANYTVSSAVVAAVARTAAVEQRHQRDRQPAQARRRVWRAGQSARLPRGQGPALRPATGDHLGRPVQRDEFRRDPGLQPGLQPDRELAGPDVGVDGPLDEDHRAVGLLKIVNGR